MLHVVAFAVTVLLFMASSLGLVVLLYMARDRIVTALRIEHPDPVPVRVAPSRVRIVARSHNAFVMPPCRVAA